MRVRPIIAVAFAVAIAASQAQATTLSGNLTVDNLFSAYISTNDATPGTLIGSGADWGTTYSLTAATLTPGVTNYLQIVGISYFPPAAFIGSFNLSDANFQFANGTQTLLTDTTNWRSNPSGGSWFAPNGTPVSLGLNGISPWGSHPTINASAAWIWSDTSDTYGATAYFSTTITPTSATPLPSTWLMLLSGFVGLGFFAYRGTKRKTAAIAA